MTNKEVKEFFRKTSELVAQYGDPEFINSNLKESIEALTLCDKITIERIEKFKHKDIIDVSFFDTLIEIEAKKGRLGDLETHQTYLQNNEKWTMFKDMIQKYNLS